jgi:pimeloyl-ACP methyl ester carboxylesterase
MATSDATIVLVHGAWHGAWCWDHVSADLSDRGFSVVAVDLPGHGASPLPLGDLYGDAAFVTQTVAAIDGPVILVGHSYGGAVITEAGPNPNVARLVYLTAFCLDEGESLLGKVTAGATAEQAAQTAALFVDQGDGTMVVAEDFIIPMFYGDCSAGDVAFAMARLGAQPMASFVQPVQRTSWRTTPSTYVVCAQDGAIAPGIQRDMAARCSTTVTLEASHSPFFSMPGAVADVLAAAAEGARS